MTDLTTPSDSALHDNEPNQGALTSVGLTGQRAVLPLLPFTNGDEPYRGSFLGNYEDLSQVLALATEGLIKHNVGPVKLDDVNENLEAPGLVDIVGRAVVDFD